VSLTDVTSHRLKQHDKASEGFVYPVRITACFVACGNSAKSHKWDFWTHVKRRISIFRIWQHAV